MKFKTIISIIFVVMLAVLIVNMVRNVQVGKERNEHLKSIANELDWINGAERIQATALRGIWGELKNMNERKSAEPNQPKKIDNTLIEQYQQPYNQFAPENTNPWK